MTEGSESFRPKTDAETRTELLAPILKRELLDVFSEVERERVKTITSLGSGTGIEGPLLVSAFPQASINLIEREESLARLAKRTLKQYDRVVSHVMDALASEALPFYEADLILIRNPNIITESQNWKEIITRIGEHLPEHGMLFMSVTAPHELQEAQEALRESGLVLHDEPKHHRTQTVDDTYTLRAGHTISESMVR